MKINIWEIFDESSSTSVLIQGKAICAISFGVLFFGHVNFYVTVFEFEHVCWVLSFLSGFSWDSDEIVSKKIDLNKINILPPPHPIFLPFYCQHSSTDDFIWISYSARQALQKANRGNIFWIHFCGPLRFIATLISGVNFYSPPPNVSCF